ncbi:MAG TPA: ATP-dependent zinc metalloprotease FtsH, partial [Solirubrobacteraceae bacterium]|nr:ATP-dependent zinc metalloprotease FtsH [Solirubrobacteraceae bacterium]
MPQESSAREPERLSEDRSDPHPPMPRDKRGWHVAPAPDGRGMPEQAPTGPPAHRRPGFLWFVAIIIALNWLSLLVFQPSSGQPRITVPFKPFFLQEVQSGQVRSISAKGDTIQGTLKAKVKYPAHEKSAKPTTLFETQVPSFWNNAQLSALLKEENVTINAKSTSESRSLLSELLLGFGPTLLIVGLFVLLARRAAKAGGGMGALGAFGRSQARRVDPETIRVMFADVAGIDEAKAELSEVVDFLRNPERYGRLGGRMPHGVLLSGAPGTGKTLLARAVAGEAHAAFFSISASEFIEAIVGVGASRVRDLFAKAKEAAPAIIFIDELDAIGRSRQGSISVTGANDEREQTLDQILTEIDGFESSEAVVVLAATNRPDVLDPALLRAGRFDRRVAVQAPDRAGRAAILEVHTRSIPLDAGVDLDALAASTPGMVGADLANLANEAALLAARREHEKVMMSDFTDSLEKIMLGSPRGILLSPADRRRTAHHEAGHALVGMLTPGADPVRKVSIIPRGMALGVTLSTPDSDRVSYSLEDLEGKIKVALGGRVAEEIVYGTITTGAESDIQQLTQIARQMVGRWGMSTAI